MPSPAWVQQVLDKNYDPMNLYEMVLANHPTVKDLHRLTVEGHGAVHDVIAVTENITEDDLTYIIKFSQNSSARTRAAGHENMRSETLKKLLDETDLETDPDFPLAGIVGNLNLTEQDVEEYYYNQGYVVSFDRPGGTNFFRGLLIRNSNSSIITPMIVQGFKQFLRAPEGSEWAELHRTIVGFYSGTIWEHWDELKDDPQANQDLLKTLSPDQWKQLLSE